MYTYLLIWIKTHMSKSQQHHKFVTVCGSSVKLGMKWGAAQTQNLAYVAVVIFIIRTHTKYRNNPGHHKFRIYINEPYVIQLHKSELHI